MGFFDEMLAGTIAGVGKGMSDFAVQRQRDEEKQAMLDERLAAQRQMQQDRFQQQKDMLELRSSLAGGGASHAGGKGGSGINLLQMALDAKTPEDQDKVVNLFRLLKDDMGLTVADQLYKRPVMEQKVVNQPTTGDLARFDRGEQASIPEAQTVSTPVAYDKNKGSIALQRMYALMLDPAKADNQASAERQWTQSDFGGAAARQVLSEGGSMEDAGETFGTISNSKLNTSRNDVDTKRLAAEEAKRQSIESKATADRESRDKNARIDDARKTWQALLKDGSDQTAIKAAYDEYQALKGTPVAQQPKFPYLKRSPADAAAAYKGK